MIDWFSIVIYFGLLLGWSPEAWSIYVPQIAVMAVGTVLLVRQILGKEPLTFHLDTLILALLVGWGPLQLAAGFTVQKFETWNALLYWLTIAVIYLTARTLLVSRSALEHFLTIQVVAGTGLAVMSVLLFFSTPLKVYFLFPSYWAAYGPFVYKNQFAAFLELLMPLAFYRILTDRKRRLAYMAAYAALFACMVTSLSRAGFALAGVELVFLGIYSAARGKVTWKAVLQVGVPLAAMLVIFSLVVGWDSIETRLEEHESFQARGNLAASAIDMIRARPLTGFGLGTWRGVYPAFAHFDIFRMANEAHNDWLQWGAEGGVIFMLLMLILVIWVSRFVWNHIWGLGVPIVFIHCFLDYPTREPALAALLFSFAGALAATRLRKKLSSRPTPEWQVLSVRAAAD